ncbi:MAG TPA: DUF262 domain-containing protein [Catenuloplanes sp.]
MTVCLIGTTQPHDRFRVRTLHLGDHPEQLVPILRQLHDDAHDWPSVTATLLEHTWAELSVEARHDSTDPTAVPGIGYTAADDSPLLDGRITDLAPIDVTWLYLIDPAADTVAVYEATRRDRWLPHSRHHLSPDDGAQPQPNPPADTATAMRAAVMTRQTTAPLTHLWTSSSDRYVEDHTNGIRRGSIVLDPPYQRGSVWTTDQQIALMRSWLMGVPVAAITLNNRMGREWHAGDPHARTAYAVVDGRQRLETALAWEDGTLAVPASWLPPDWIHTTQDTDDGPYVHSSGLTEAGRRRVHSQMSLPCVVARLPDTEAEAELYLLVNGGGTPQSATDLANAARIAGR